MTKTKIKKQIFVNKTIYSAYTCKKPFSTIIPRGDACKTKVEKVNSLLQEFCENDGIDLILHDNINAKRHLNKGKLHLNETGISRFVRNFSDFLNIFEIAWHESTHNLFNLSGSSSLSGSPSLSTIDKHLSKIQQQRIMYTTKTPLLVT